MAQQNGIKIGSHEKERRAREQLSVKNDFTRQFQKLLEEVPLPARILSRWQPESCLSHKEDGEIWLLRDAEEKRFLLKTDTVGRRNLAGEFELLQRFPPELAGKVPEATDYFEEEGVRYLIRTWLPGHSLSQIQEKKGVFSPERCVIYLRAPMRRRLWSGLTVRRT